MKRGMAVAGLIVVTAIGAVDASPAISRSIA